MVRRWRKSLFWVVFALGVLLQAFGPHLKIKDNGFIVTTALSAGTEIRPDELVAQERRMQLLSAALTLGGAIGLALCYREVLFGTRSARHDLVGKEHAVSNSSGTVK